MKIRVILIDDKGKEFFGEVELQSIKQPSKQKLVLQKIDNYAGLRGGINFLINNDYFTKLKTTNEVQAELKKENYFHSIQSVDKRLRFLVSKKILTRIKEENVWKYAKRR